MSDIQTTQDTTQPEGTEETTPSEPSGSLSQADLDRIVTERLSRARRQWEQEAKEAQERASLSAEEKAKAELQDAKSQVKAAQEAQATTERMLSLAVAAAAAGVRGDTLDRFLKLAALEPGDTDPKKVVAQVLKEFPMFAAKPVPTGADGGAGSGAGAPTVTLDQFKTMNMGDRTKLQREQRVVYDQLRDQMLRG